ncbi:MAG: sigma-70 family RNA polymerase sigma factor [Roseivirga sp.]|jgi:RNA polymerase sigma-70 factor (ECF subfamily)|uniref:RNA polymerase sigma factor n=1 Tax=Roseivirga sp. TaxID=1964215 RepID=UPI001B21882E|nr:sigma-70 family RNA polymerase sigma factor [Roseivirga sp.]MBO6496827.1 sigma-70 family RNA polymerase sigma factor [Roseivirga sp.]
MSENSLILRLKTGDKEALEEIYRKFRPSFIKWITYSHKCSYEQAIDIFQYAILSFYENVLEDVIEEMNDAGIKTYLYSIGKNKLLSDSRRDSKLSFNEEYEDHLLLEELDETQQDSDSKINQIKGVIENLQNPCADILRLFYFNNLSNDEIAEILGYKNGNTVKNLKYKCIQRIKRLLQ